MLPLSPTLFDHLVATLICVVLPVLGVLQRRSAQPSEPVRFESRHKIATYWGNSVLLALICAVGLAAWRYAGRSWSDLGLTAAPQRLDWGLPLAALFLLLYAVDTWRELTQARLPATRARWRRDTPFMPETARELRHSMVMVVAAAVGEEILYRGFLISYAAAFTGSSVQGLAAAVMLPAAAFAVTHLYQGWRAVLKIVLLAGMFGAIFMVTRSLWIPIALHFVVDLIGMLLGPKLLAPDPERLDGQVS